MIGIRGDFQNKDMDPSASFIVAKETALVVELDTQSSRWIKSG